MYDLLQEDKCESVVSDIEPYRQLPTEQNTSDKPKISVIRVAARVIAVPLTISAVLKLLAAIGDFVNPLLLK